MEQLPSMPSTSGARSDQFRRNVFLLKNGDFERINGQVHMPTKGEMATIRTRTGQYRRDVEFYQSMSSDMVKKKLEETFPYLKNKGFVCAAKKNLDDDTARFDFDGSPRRWNGRTIKRKIQGNSNLYILENDQMDTSSGISASDSESSQDVTEMSSLLPWLRNNLHFDVDSNPNYSPLQGGGPCIFTFTPRLHSEVTSVYATFEGLGTQEVDFSRKGWLGFFPASQVPKVVSVTLKSQDGIILGRTQVTYGANLQQVVSCPSVLKKFCEDYNNMYGRLSGNPSGNPGTSGGGTENSGTLGCNQPVQMLSLLVYVAAEVGAQQFIEIIFTSSAGRVVFNAYKDNLTLPEVIARDHGNEETANYLEDVTKRFSEKTTTGKECSQTIDWSELVKAAEAVEKQLDLTNENEYYQKERVVAKETGYLGDVDTSCSDSSQPQGSDSEDDIPIMSRKETPEDDNVTDQSGSSNIHQTQLQISDSSEEVSPSLDIFTNSRTSGGDRKCSKAESNSDQEGKIWLQRDRQSQTAAKKVKFGCKEYLRQEGIYAKEVKFGCKECLRQEGIYAKNVKFGCKEYLRQKSIYAKKVKSFGCKEIFMHPNDPNRGTQDPIVGNYRDFKETLHQFEVEVFPSTSGFMKAIILTMNNLPKKINFSDLSEVEKLKGCKDLKELQMKTNKMFSKAKNTIKSLRAAAAKLDELWTMCKAAQAAGSTGSLVGGFLTIAGGIATVMSAGAASPLLLAGIGIGVAGASTNVVSNIVKSSISTSEIKKAEKDLQDTRDSINDVKNTIQVWLHTKGEEELLYICRLAALTLKLGDPTIKLLQNAILPSLLRISVKIPEVTGEVALKSGVAVAGRAAAQSGAKAGVKGGGSLADRLMIGVSPVFTVWDFIDLGFTIKDIVQNKGSEAARSLRQRADKIENDLVIFSKV